MEQILDKQECEICKKEINISAQWPFSICEDCAKEKWKSWKSFFFEEIYGVDEDYEWMLPPILPMSLKLGNYFTKKYMTCDDAARIQSHADKNNMNQDFKARAQSAAAKHKFIFKSQNGECSVNVFYDENFKLYLIPKK